MILTPYTAKNDLGEIENLYESAFPVCERKPFRAMVERINHGVEMLGIEEDGEFVGLAIVLVTDTIALLDYFAILPEKRGNGIGGRALAKLRERYRNHALLIEIEDPSEPCDNRHDRVRRLAFYRRNGMIEMPYLIWFYGTKMLVLTNGIPVTFAEHYEVYRLILGENIAQNITLVSS